MPAHSRGNLSLEAYLTRILAALAKRNGGELRIKGAEVDAVDNTTNLMKDWDPKRQEVVLRFSTPFSEIYRVAPERPAQRETPVHAPPIEQGELPLSIPRRSSTVDDNEKLARIVNNLNKRKIARMIVDEQAERRRAAFE